MSKLSAALRALIDVKSPQLPAWPLARFRAVVEKIEEEAEGRGLGANPWLAIVMAVSMTAGSHEPVAVVAQHITKTLPSGAAVKAAEFMREVGIICMAMNGVRIDAQRKIC